MRIILASILLAATASAQTCCNLSVTGTSTLTVSLTGAPPLSFALLALGGTAGTTVINFGLSFPCLFCGAAGSGGSLATLNLGLAMPFVPVPMGMTNPQGSASVTIRIPATLPARDLVTQGIAASFSITPPAAFSLSFCTSNVVAFHVGS